MTGWVGCWLLQCKAGGGQGRAGRGKGEEQGTAVRRIEGFEKRQSAKPKRCLVHPPGPSFVRFRIHPRPWGNVVLRCLAAHCRGYGGTHCHACVFFAGVSLRRPRQSCCVWPDFFGKRLLVWANQPSSRG